jgi:8-oxo-dGTP diphosphatase
MRKAARAIVVKDDALLVMHRNKFGEQYYALVGGAIKPGESAEQAALREVREETSLAIANPRLVFIEQPGEPFGTQYIFLCDYQTGAVALPPESEEAKIHALGSNLYEPMWLPVKQLPDVPFLSTNLKRAIVHGLLRGFPQQPERL